MTVTEYDVCVAGGGSAGLAAAVAAARLGAKTLLVERHGQLGGMATAALVHSVCGLYQLAEDYEPTQFANVGFAQEFATCLMAAGGATGPIRMGRVDVLLHRPAAFARLADSLTRETPNLTVQLHTELVDADHESAKFSCRGISERVQAKAWVDTTGDAVLATMRGAPSEIETSKHLQRPAFIFALGGVAGEMLDDECRMRLARRIVHAVRDGKLPHATLAAHFRASPQAGEAFVTIDLDGGPDFDPLSPECLTGLENEGRELAERLTDFLRAEIDGLASAYIAAWPSRAGVRESRRVVGQYRIESEDIEWGAEFPDMVAFSAWPMEMRENTSGPKLRFPTGKNVCGVPLRALRARDDARLFMAGRCISCSHAAQAALRVIGTCLATGEAAGLAAAGLVMNGTCDADTVRMARDKMARATEPKNATTASP